MKLPFLHKSNSINSSWPWPSCQTQPRTLSFRKPNVAESAFTESTNSSESPSDEIIGPEEPETVENVIEGLRSSQRLFFDPKGKTNSILEEANNTKQEGFLLLSMESKDPYFDFKISMEEMIEAHGLRDWENLENLLCSYLKVNGKANHGYIFGAFIDLLVGFSLSESDQNVSVSSARTTTTTTRLTYNSSASCSCYNLRESPSSPLSFYASCSSSDESCSVPMETEENRDEENRASCLSSLLETEIEIEDLDDVAGYISC